MACEAAMPPSTEDDTFEGVPLSEATLYVMEQSIKSYKAADRWKQFKWIKTLSGYLVNGIYYKILSEEQKTACVVAGPVKYIGNVVIEDCVMINGSAYTVAEIGSQAFYNCSEVSSVSLPKTITSIGSQAFYGCEKIAKIVLPDDITTIGSSAFNKNIHSHDDRETNIPVYVNRGTKSLLALWASGYTPYERGKSYSMLPAPVLSYSSTQTTVTLTIEHMTYQEYTYMLDSQVMSESRSIITGMKPEESGSATLRVSLDDFIGYTNRCDYKTADISPSVTSPIVTASSLSIKGSYIHGDAVVDSIWLDVDNKVYEGDSIFLSGLDPKSNHQAIFYVRVAYGDNYEYKTTYNSNRKSGWSTYVTTLTTEDISLVTQEPHVISYGNAVVSAQSNIDDIETNVGFEWRRTDWTEEFPSNVGVAYLFGGAMEGFIRNLNTEKLWKYRPYYESSSGKRYYGDWMGIDPTNTSYFEPIVRTYPEMQVKGNTARVYGYAMPGSESMLQQGFKYWKETNGSRAFVQDNNVNVPEYANTIVVNDIVMEAELTGLDYGNTYYYVAFVTTTDGKSFYGKVLTFQTDEDLTGIQTLTNSKTKEDNRCYDLNGRPINNPRKGLYIRKGKKVLVR